MSEMPSTIGRYELVAELGRGAMGAVYRALDPLIQREVAVKTIRMHLAPREEADFRARFMREAKAAGRLNHPSIVTIYDAGEWHGVAYIVMAYLPGASLREIAVPGRPMPLDACLSIARQVAEGLACAHAAQVIHRDIKPANIMVGPDQRACITDFGIARVEGVSRTQTGIILGSPKYMSPEQIQGLPLDPRTDLYSLGATLYEIATGRPPFGAPGMSIMDLMQQVVGDAPPPPRSLSPDLPADVEEVILRALAKDRAHRHADASALAADLARLAARAGIARPSRSEKVAAPRRLVAADAAETTLATATPEGSASLGGSDAGLGQDAFHRQLLDDIDAFSRLDVPSILPAETAPGTPSYLADASFPQLSGELLAALDGTGPSAQSATRAAESAPAIAHESTLLRALASRAAMVESLRTDPTEEARKLAALRRRDERARGVAAYLRDFCRHMNTLQPPLGRVYPLMSIGQIQGLHWAQGDAGHHAREIDDEPLTTTVWMECRLKGEGSLVAEREGDGIETLRRQLREFELPFVTEEIRGRKGWVQRMRYRIAFDVAVRVAIQLEEDPDSAVLQTQNLDRLSQARYTVAAEHLDTALCDELARTILGEPSRLFAFLEPAPLEPLKSA
jgi:serine/threonine-protein kinase